MNGLLNVCVTTQCILEGWPSLCHIWPSCSNPTGYWVLRGLIHWQRVYEESSFQFYLKKICRGLLLSCKSVQHIRAVPAEASGGHYELQKKPFLVPETWGLGTETGSSRRASISLDHWTISPSPVSCLVLFLFFFSFSSLSSPLFLPLPTSLSSFFSFLRQSHVALAGLKLTV